MKTQITIIQKSRLFTLIFFLVLSTYSNGQVLDWVHDIGVNTGYDQGENLIYKDAHIYIIGKFEGQNVDFDFSSTSSFTLSSNGGFDIFVAKYDSSGNFVWAFSIGGSQDDIGRDLAIYNDQLFIIGDFESNNTDFDPSSNTANLSSHGDADIFVAKFDTAGNYINAMHMGDPYKDKGNAIDVDANGIYITGYFQGNNVSFSPLGGNSITLSDYGSDLDIYIASYNHSLAGRWGFRIGKDEDDESNDIDVHNGSVYVTGYFKGDNVDFNPGSGNNYLHSEEHCTSITIINITITTCTTTPDIFIAKYDANTGAYQWAFDIGNNVRQFNIFGYKIGFERGQKIQVVNNKIYLGGVFSGTVDFDPSSGNTNLTTGGLNVCLLVCFYVWPDDCFIAQYDLNGNFEWARNFGDKANVIPDELYGMSVNDSGDVAVSGIFANSILDLSTPLTTNQNNGWDFYVTQFDKDGNFDWAFSAGGSGTSSNDADNAKGLVHDNKGSIYVTGRFFSPNAHFDPNPPPQTTLYSGSSADAFIAKYFDAPVCFKFDKIELTQLYNNANGMNWLNTWNLSNNTLSTWYGISFNTEGCVRSIDLDTNNLTGTLPNLAMDGLEYLSLSHNQLNGYFPSLLNSPNVEYIDISSNSFSNSLPNLSHLPLNTLNVSDNGFTILPNLTNITTFSNNSNEGLNVSHNKLTFEDILPNISIGNNSNFIYAPQDTAGFIHTQHLPEGSSGSIQLNFDNNITGEYIWLKDGVVYDTTTTNSLNFTTVEMSDTGSYTCIITNSSAPNLTLHTYPIRLEVCEKPNLGNDTIICFNDSLILATDVSAELYQWNGSYSSDSTYSVMASDTVILNQFDTVQINFFNFTFWFSECTNSDTIIVTIPSEITLVPTIQHITCFGANDGSISMSINGGITPYTYEWYYNNNLISTDTSISNLAAGSYQVIITDSIGCQKIANYTINEGIDILTTNPTIQPVSCFGGNDGAITLAPTGGTPNYSYNWNTPPNNLPIGTYYVTITDSYGCQKYDSVSVAQPTQLIPNATPNSKTCPEGNKGGALATAIGGTPPYSYLWLESNETTIQANFLPGGINHLVVTDANNCSETATFIIDSVTNFIASCISDTLPCFGDSSGTVQVNTMGGDTPYSYQWTYNGNTNAINTGLPFGTYWVTVTDSNDCEFVPSAIVNQPPLLEIQTLLVEDVLCHGDSSGQVTTQALGGTAPYNYQWSDGNISSNHQTLPAGQHLLTVTDDSGCVALDTFDILQPSPMVITSTIVGDSCSEQTGQVSLTTTGGVGGYQYHWSQNSNLHDSILINMSSGIYLATVIDSNGCVKNLPIAIPSPCDSCLVFPSLTSLVSDYTCLGSGIGELTIHTGGGQPAYNNHGLYFFDISGTNNGGDGIESDAGGELFFQVATPTTWQVVITDASGCDTLTLSNDFLENAYYCDNYCELYPLTMNIVNDTTIRANEPIPLRATGNGTVTWQSTNPLENLSCINCAYQEVAPMYSTSYIATLVDGSGCEVTDTVHVTVCTECPCQLVSKPHLLTPNGDGIYDRLEFENIGLCANRNLRIFDRYGQQVVDDMRDYDNNWDGGNLPSGTYYYILTGGQHIPERITGYFTLLRN